MVEVHHGLEGVIAFGSWMPASRASSYQRWNIATGSGSRSDSVSPPRVYSARAEARESVRDGASLTLPTVRHNAPHG